MHLGGEDGYRLWLRYDRVSDAERLTEYRAAFRSFAVPATSPVLRAAGEELGLGMRGLLDAPIESTSPEQATLLAGTPASLPGLDLEQEVLELGHEGFRIVHRGERTIVTAPHDVGVLYGVFSLLRSLKLETPIARLERSEKPRVRYRMLDHWDNLDRTVERGYAGFSLWNWHTLPDYLAPRYTDYARANASLGINAVALTNVNADARVLTPYYLRKVAALAEVFRPYGIKVFLTARFSAPVEIGNLETADPIVPAVASFWRDKTREIYDQIPDFGGFLVKANSEGQPGPGDYGRTHAEGANLLADALKEHGGIVIWRAFVYDKDVPEDRAKQAYQEFVPLDGKFRSNAVVQVKNGPIDFQPREPFHPLFGAMPQTPLFLEFQITQEYLGFASHLVYLGTLFEETLRADTFVKGPGSEVARVADGSLYDHELCGIAAVSNIGTDHNWCGHPFAAANWYAFGRLAWDHRLSAEALADEWLRQTFSSDARFVEPAKAMMLASREACVDYMTPLGLHHLMGRDHHYGPEPWLSEGRADWTSVYYHRADLMGLGFDRTERGSNAIALYAEPLRERFSRLETCPETLWLWFHHVSWKERLPSGRTLWEELCHRYDAGVARVRDMAKTWHALLPFVDARRHAHVAALLRVQEKEASWWRDACLLYFQTFASQPLPEGCTAPAHDLAYFKAIQHHHVPGI